MGRTVPISPGLLCALILSSPAAGLAGDEIHAIVEAKGLLCTSASHPVKIAPRTMSDRIGNPQQLDARRQVKTPPLPGRARPTKASMKRTGLSEPT
jgi:hypothetical protein